jgi:hypothetical protein
LRCLKHFWNTLFKTERKAVYAPDFKCCILARFIFDERHWSKVKNKPKYNAFMPQNKYPEELSVYEIKGLDAEVIWSLAQHVRTDKEVLSRADVCWPLVNDKSTELLKRLELKHDGKPHERHCNISGFSGDKEKDKLVALELAELATLVRYPSKS